MYLKTGCYFFFFFLQLVSLAQDGDRLILEKMGRKYRIVYQTGDEIILKLRGDQKEFHGTITEFYNSTIVIEGIYVNLKDIHYVKTVHTEGFLSPGNGPKLIIAGVGLFLIDQLNHSVIQGNDFRIPEGVAIISGSLIVAGAFWTSLKYRKFKPGKNRRIRIFRL
ncbi:MAG: hypothetical protein KFF73_10265 [Cyclobacteriaceae bacterium]|nr:hypothetical protein [Cyclobacteriaceae bacterium]